MATSLIETLYNKHRSVYRTCRRTVLNTILYFFQKIKRPAVLKGVTTKKRSEITSILIQESVNLEREEGRQMVKVKVKDPPFSFNANYSQQNTPTGL